jgi:hypothetical protein
MHWHTWKEFRNIISFALQHISHCQRFATAARTCTITQQLSLELCFAISSPVKGILLAFGRGGRELGRMIAAGYLAGIAKVG